MKPCLELDRVNIAYGSQYVIRNCNIRLARGEILSLLGASGCGKSTLLRAIAGLMPINSGEIRMQGRTVSDAHHSLPPQQREVGMIFQDYALFPHLNVIENISFGLTHLKAENRRQRARDILAVVQLQALEKRYPHQLSGGQQQRVAIARALVREPACLLLDEPFSNLDNAVREALMDDMHRLFRAQKISAIFVTHNKTEAFALADTVAIIDNGEIAQTGNPTTLYDHPANDSIAAFLGHGTILHFIRRGDYWENSVGRIAVATRARLILRDEGPDGANIYLRPHQLRLERGDDSNAQIEHIRFFGDTLLYRLRLDGQQAEILSKDRYQTGDRVRLSLAL